MLTPPFGAPPTAAALPIALPIGLPTARAPTQLDLQPAVKGMSAS